MRPGLMDTPATRSAAQLDRKLFPLSRNMARNLDARSMDPDKATKQIWARLVEPPSEALVRVGTGG